MDDLISRDAALTALNALVQTMRARDPLSLVVGGVLDSMLAIKELPVVDAIPMDFIDNFIMETYNDADYDTSISVFSMVELWEAERKEKHG